MLTCCQNNSNACMSGVPAHARDRASRRHRHCFRRVDEEEHQREKPLYHSEVCQEGCVLFTALQVFRRQFGTDRRVPGLLVGTYLDAAV